MATPGTRNDPYGGFNFMVSFIETPPSLPGGASFSTAGGSASAAGGFSEVIGLEGSMQVEDYSEGGENAFVHKFFTRMTWSNLTLRRGVSFDTSLWDWHAGYVRGSGKRRDGMIVLLDEDRRPAKRWVFRRGLPLKWSGPTLNAQQGAVAIEAIEIAHQGLELM